jgi:hypothetical protein
MCFLAAVSAFARHRIHQCRQLGLMAAARLVLL